MYRSHRTIKKIQFSDGFVLTLVQNRQVGDDFEKNAQEVVNAYATNGVTVLKSTEYVNNNIVIL